MINDVIDGNYELEAFDINSFDSLLQSLNEEEPDTTDYFRLKNLIEATGYHLKPVFFRDYPNNRMNPQGKIYILLRPVKYIKSVPGISNDGIIDFSEFDIRLNGMFIRKEQKKFKIAIDDKTLSIMHEDKYYPIFRILEKTQRYKTIIGDVYFHKKFEKISFFGNYYENIYEFFLDINDITPLTIWFDEDFNIIRTEFWHRAGFIRETN